jgi:hypothetical protein
MNAICVIEIHTIIAHLGLKDQQQQQLNTVFHSHIYNHISCIIVTLEHHTTISVAINKTAAWNCYFPINDVVIQEYGVAWRPIPLVWSPH